MDNDKDKPHAATRATTVADDSSGDVSGKYYPTAVDSIHGYGTELLVGDGAATEKFEAVAGITKITPGAMQTADIKTTHLRSPDAHEEHRPGMRDSAAFSCDVIWLPLSESQSNAGGGTGAFTSGGVIALWRSRKIANFQIKLPDLADGTPGPIWPFTAYVSQFQPGELNHTDVSHATVGFQPVKAYDAALP